jgi:hypothetical protein
MSILDILFISTVVLFSTFLVGGSIARLIWTIREKKRLREHYDQCECESPEELFCCLMDEADRIVEERPDWQLRWFTGRDKYHHLCKAVLIEKGDLPTGITLQEVLIRVAHKPSD